jgi:hypothetical protein
MFALALALAWLPMSTFAQICATHSMAMKTGGAHHPALPQSVAEFEAAALEGVVSLDSLGATVIVVDAETFWHSVDTYEDNCHSKALCAFAGAAVPPLTSSVVAFDSELVFDSTQSFFPRSRVSAPATPPPRTFS